MLRWLYNLLPCLHDYHRVTIPFGWLDGRGHELRCKKCNVRASCRCSRCREPWRDW